VRLHHLTLSLFADYHQFYLWDGGAEPQAPEHYSDEDVRQRIKTGPHVVAVRTARNTVVPVEVEVWSTPPSLDPAGWDHVVEASLHLPTGGLSVEDCTGGTVAAVPVTPGWYRLRAMFGGLDTISEDGLSGHDRYHIALWPARQDDVQVFKRRAGG
jgi:hypothetical protein